jgi:hypothetical protein
MHVAVLANARKLAMLCWRLMIDDEHLRGRSTDAGRAQRPQARTMRLSVDLFPATSMAGGDGNRRWNVAPPCRWRHANRRPAPLLSTQTVLLNRPHNRSTKSPQRARRGRSCRPICPDS